MRDKYLETLDLTNQTFGRLTVIRKIPNSRSRWLCKCSCGNEKEVIASQLIHGRVQSCNCLEKENRDLLKSRVTKHGKTNSILYSKWSKMKERCYYPNYKYFYRYGGRGIKVCPEWLGEHGFEHFEEWAYSAGYTDSKIGYEQSLDRIDIDGDYSPQNCKWSNQIEQVGNRSNSRLVDDNGEKLTSVQFAKKHNIDSHMFVYRRIRKGYTSKQIIDEWNSKHIS